MNNALTRAVFCAALSAACLAANGADAQLQRLQFEPMNFDLWCQEHMHHSPKRCDKRLPEDDAAFQDYSNKMEGYETQQLNSQARDRRLNNTILRSDPSANPAGTPPTQPIPPPQ
jgi:hypothetical protein